MMVMMMVMARVMPTQAHDHTVMMMVMVVMMVAELHRNLRNLFGGPLREPRIVSSERR